MESELLGQRSELRLGLGPEQRRMPGRGRGLEVGRLRERETCPGPGSENIRDQ